ncbi:uncharacterized protein LOC106461550 isoform X2 [Limulus polyphemus]|uniref:Protein transport protein sec16 n=1 Tax=Limulus polyphemus TaxID=6850 RepID=A0ABM1SKU4_LIMPO|nr:uncharacterized protein LOC106461550 isoform X2 [Limulus polyphemus]
MSKRLLARGRYPKAPNQAPSTSASQWSSPSVSGLTDMNSSADSSGIQFYNPQALGRQVNPGGSTYQSSSVDPWNWEPEGGQQQDNVSGYEANPTPPNQYSWNYRRDYVAENSSHPYPLHSQQSPPQYMLDAPQSPTQHMSDAPQSPPQHMLDAPQSPPRHMLDSQPLPPQHMLDSQQLHKHSVDSEQVKSSIADSQQLQHHTYSHHVSQQYTIDSGQMPHLYSIAPQQMSQQQQVDLQQKTQQYQVNSQEMSHYYLDNSQQLSQQYSTDPQQILQQQHQIDSYPLSPGHRADSQHYYGYDPGQISQHNVMYSQLVPQQPVGDSPNIPMTQFADSSHLENSTLNTNPSWNSGGYTVPNPYSWQEGEWHDQSSQSYSNMPSSDDQNSHLKQVQQGWHESLGIQGDSRSDQQHYCASVTPKLPVDLHVEQKDLDACDEGMSKFFNSDIQDRVETVPPPSQSIGEIYKFQASDQAAMTEVTHSTAEDTSVEEVDQRMVHNLQNIGKLDYLTNTCPEGSEMIDFDKQNFVIQEGQSGKGKEIDPESVEDLSVSIQKINLSDEPVNKEIPEPHESTLKHQDQSADEEQNFGHVLENTSGSFLSSGSIIPIDTAVKSQLQDGLSPLQGQQFEQEEMEMPNQQNPQDIFGQLPSINTGIPYSHPSQGGVPVVIKPREGSPFKPPTKQPKGIVQQEVLHHCLSVSSSHHHDGIMLEPDNLEKPPDASQVHNIHRHRYHLPRNTFGGSPSTTLWDSPELPSVHLVPAVLPVSAGQLETTEMNPCIGTSENSSSPAPRQSPLGEDSDAGRKNQTIQQVTRSETEEEDVLSSLQKIDSPAPPPAAAVHLLQRMSPAGAGLPQVMPKLSPNTEDENTKRDKNYQKGTLHSHLPEDHQDLQCGSGMDIIGTDSRPVSTHCGLTSSADIRQSEQEDWLMSNRVVNSRWQVNKISNERGEAGVRPEVVGDNQKRSGEDKDCSWPMDDFSGEIDHSVVRPEVVGNNQSGGDSFGRERKPEEVKNSQWELDELSAVGEHSAARPDGLRNSHIRARNAHRNRSEDTRTNQWVPENLVGVEKQEAVRPEVLGTSQIRRENRKLAGDKKYGDSQYISGQVETDISGRRFPEDQHYDGGSKSSSPKRPLSRSGDPRGQNRLEAEHHRLESSCDRHVDRKDFVERKRDFDDRRYREYDDRGYYYGDRDRSRPSSRVSHAESLDGRDRYRGDRDSRFPYYSDYNRPLSRAETERPRYSDSPADYGRHDRNGYYSRVREQRGSDYDYYQRDPYYSYYDPYRYAYSSYNYGFYDELYRTDPLYRQQMADRYRQYYAQLGYDTSEFDRLSVHSGRSSVNEELRKDSQRDLSRTSLSGLDYSSYSQLHEFDASYTSKYAESSRVQETSTVATPPRLTPAKFSTPHLVSRFTPGGYLLKVSGSSQTSSVEIHDVQNLILSGDYEELRVFPGPLVRGRTHKNDVIHFCQRKIDHFKSIQGLADRESFILLWELLVLILRQNGSIVGSDIAELLLANHEILKSKQTMEQSTNFSPQEELSPEIRGTAETSPDEGIVVAQDRTLLNSSRTLVVEDVTRKFREFLLFGNKKDSLEWAMKHGLWGHALFLASKMDSRTYGTVMTRFANSLTLNDPLQTLYQLMSGRQPAAVTCVAEERWGDWRPHLAMILSNPSQRPDLDQRSITTLGDTLGSQGCLAAAHFCYLMAQTDFGIFSQKSSKLILLGANHMLSFSEFASNEAIQCTEIFEYGMSLGTQGYVLPHLQAYKFLYATCLVDSGLLEEALHYCEVISETVIKMPQMYSSTLVSQVYELASKLKYHDPHYTQEQGEFEELNDPLWLINLANLHQAFMSTTVLPNYSLASTTDDMIEAPPVGDVTDSTSIYSGAVSQEGYQNYAPEEQSSMHVTNYDTLEHSMSYNPGQFSSNQWSQSAVPEQQDTNKYRVTDSVVTDSAAQETTPVLSTGMGTFDYYGASTQQERRSCSPPQVNSNLLFFEEHHQCLCKSSIDCKQNWLNVQEQFLVESSNDHEQSIPNSSCNQDKILPESSSDQEHVFPNSSCDQYQSLQESCSEREQTIPNSSCNQDQILPESSSDHEHVFPKYSCVQYQSLRESSSEREQSIPNSSCNEEQILCKSFAAEELVLHKSLKDQEATSNKHILSTHSTSEEERLFLYFNGQQNIVLKSSHDQDHCLAESSVNQGHTLSKTSNHKIQLSSNNQKPKIHNFSSDQNQSFPSSRKQSQLLPLCSTNCREAIDKCSNDKEQGCTSTSQDRNINYPHLTDLKQDLPEYINDKKLELPEFFIDEDQDLSDYLKKQNLNRCITYNELKGGLPKAISHKELKYSSDQESLLPDSYRDMDPLLPKSDSESCEGGSSTTTQSTPHHGPSGKANIEEMQSLLQKDTKPRLLNSCLKSDKKNCHEQSKKKIQFDMSTSKGQKKKGTDVGRIKRFVLYRQRLLARKGLVKDITDSSSDCSPEKSHLACSSNSQSFMRDCLSDINSGSTSQVSDKDSGKVQKIGIKMFRFGCRRKKKKKNKTVIEKIETSKTFAIDKPVELQHLSGSEKLTFKRKELLNNHQTKDSGNLFKTSFSKRLTATVNSCQQPSYTELHLAIASLLKKQPLVFGGTFPIDEPCTVKVPPVALKLDRVATPSNKGTIQEYTSLFRPVGICGERHKKTTFPVDAPCCSQPNLCSEHADYWSDKNLSSSDIAEKQECLGETSVKKKVLRKTISVDYGQCPDKQQSSFLRCRKPERQERKSEACSRKSYTVPQNHGWVAQVGLKC